MALVCFLSLIIVFFCFELCREANFMSSSDASQRKCALSRLMAIANDADCPPSVQKRVSGQAYMQRGQKFWLDSWNHKVV
jgi:hypothetical protein